MLNLFESKAPPTGKHNEEHDNTMNLITQWIWRDITEIVMKKLLSFKLHVQKLGVIIHYNKQ